MALTAFKTRIHLNNHQQGAITKWAHARKYAYNWALRCCLLSREQSLDGRFKLSLLDDFDKWFNAGKYDLKTAVPKARGTPSLGSGEHTWLRGIPGSVCQYAIRRDLKEAWKRFFKGLGGSPKFQGRHRRLSVKLSNVDIKAKHLALSGYVELPHGLGRAKLGDPCPYVGVGKLNNTTFTKSGGRWYVSFGFEVPDDHHQRAGAVDPQPVGIDLGITTWAMLSNGQSFDLPQKKLNALEQKARNLQYRLDSHLIRSAKVIVSQCPNERCRNRPFQGRNEIRYYCANCRKAIRIQGSKEKKLRAAIARIREKQAKLRMDAIHKLSTHIASTHSPIIIEDLRLKNMTASAKGTLQSPGRQVKQKAALNRQMLNSSGYTFREKLHYKAERYGAILLTVPPEYTSQTCSVCGHTHPQNRKDKRFRCLQCGHTEDADLNAAKVIAQRGLKMLNTS